MKDGGGIRAGRGGRRQGAWIIRSEGGRWEITGTSVKGSPGGCLEPSGGEDSMADHGVWWSAGGY